MFVSLNGNIFLFLHDLNFSEMNYIDITGGLLLLFAAVIGFKKGLVYELASLAALILGIWGAILFSGLVANYMEQKFSWNFEFQGLLAFFITFIIIVILVHLVGRLLTKLVNAISLGFLNHFLGLLFGTLKGVFILSVLLFIYEKFDSDGYFISKEHREQSKIYEPIRSFAPTILPFMDIFDREKPTEEKEQA